MEKKKKSFKDYITDFRPDDSCKLEQEGDEDGEEESPD